MIFKMYFFLLDYFAQIPMVHTIFIIYAIKPIEKKKLVKCSLCDLCNGFFFHFLFTYLSTTFAMMLYWIHWSALDAEYSVKIAKTIHRLVYTWNSPISSVQNKSKPNPERPPRKKKHQAHETIQIRYTDWWRTFWTRK